jgi:hypothetical protein
LAVASFLLRRRDTAGRHAEKIAQPTRLTHGRCATLVRQIDLVCKAWILSKQLLERVFGRTAMVHVVLRSVLPALAMFAGLLPHSALAQDKSGCDDLFRQKIENVNLLSSALVPAQGDLPAYCRVLGVVRPAINFEVRFPASNWNGKFYMAGCGGFCGTLDSDRPVLPTP